MQNILGFETQIFQLAGGIIRYLEEYGPHGYFRGKHYVFDRRRVEDPRYARKSLTAVEHSYVAEEVLSACILCGKSWDDTVGHRRCSKADCNIPVLVCRLCQSRGECKKVKLFCELCAAEPDKVIAVEWTDQY